MSRSRTFLIAIGMLAGQTLSGLRRLLFLMLLRRRRRQRGATVCFCRPCVRYVNFSLSRAGRIDQICSCQTTVPARLPGDDWAARSAAGVAGAGCGPAEPLPVAGAGAGQALLLMAGRSHGMS